MWRDDVDSWYTEMFSSDGSLLRPPPSNNKMDDQASLPRRATRPRLQLSEEEEHKRGDTVHYAEGIAEAEADSWFADPAVPFRGGESKGPLPSPRKDDQASSPAAPPRPPSPAVTVSASETLEEFAQRYAKEEDVWKRFLMSPLPK